MNCDFHYYATYLAARTAGFPAEHAEKICYAAQLVDDCNSRFFLPNVDFEQIETSRATEDIAAEVAHMLTPYTDQDVEKAKRIWSCFHFLPGNQDGRVGYHGKTASMPIVEPYWRFDSRKFQMMCLPESGTAQRMIQETVDHDHESADYLHLVGIRMHVLADTWAHMYFAGIPEWCINDVRQSEGVEEFDHGAWCEDKLDLTYTDSPQAHRYQAARLTSIRYVSPLYLGHAQLGQMPDFSYLKFRYLPVWREKLGRSAENKVERDNSQLFLHAFLQMYCALKTIRNGGQYPRCVNKEAVEPDLQDQILSVLQVRKLDPSAEWKALVQKHCGDVPPDYDRDLWKNRCRDSKEKAGTDYFLFCKAAKTHRDIALQRYMV